MDKYKDKYDYLSAEWLVDRFYHEDEYEALRALCQWFRDCGMMGYKESDGRINIFFDKENALNKIGYLIMEWGTFKNLERLLSMR